MKIKSDKPISIRPLFNIGALLDIPTGNFTRGARNEMILSGGASNIVVFSGIGNSFKSTLMHYTMLQAANRINYSLKLIDKKVSMHTYDTENNMVMNIERINRLSERMDEIVPEPLYDEDEWSFIAKADTDANDWIDLIYKAGEEKRKDKKNLITYDCFINKITKKPLTVLIPGFVEIDSFSEFESNKTSGVVSKGDIDNSNTLFMQQGLFKTKVVKDLPNLSSTTETSFFLTAHVGNEINMASGPFAPQPNKALQHVKTGQKIKGISDKLLFLSTLFWQAFSTSVFINQTTKMPEYPKGKDDVPTDLNIVRIKQLRSKSGPSGFVLEILISQTEGVLPALTEFHNLKTNKYGITGNNLSYHLDIYPEVRLSRTKVRSKIDEDKKLRRALNIQSELLQMTIFMRQYSRYFVTPLELYEGIKEKGYDWDYILEHTRGWHTPKQYDTPLKFLSTLDLLKMNAGNYTPYWHTPKKDKKTTGEENE